MLETEQQTVFKWLKEILQLPVYADVYKGALELLDKKPSGYITLVSHAGRDLINCLAATTIGADRSRDEYKNNLDTLKKCWKKEGNVKATEEGHLISSATCKLIQKLVDDDESGQLRATALVDLFFDTFLDYADREKISPNLYQKSEKAREWFMKHAHVREPDFRDDTPSAVESHFQTLDELLYVAACSQFGRIRILDGILKSQKKPKYPIIVDRALELVKNRFDHQYFFTRLKNPHWIQPLANRGCFQSPPSVMHFDDGSVQFPMWPELRYLKNVASDVPNEVTKLILALPKVDNPWIYNEVLEIALQLSGKQSTKLLPKILEATGLEDQFWAHQYESLLTHWIAANKVAAAFKLTTVLVEFIPDPDSVAKRRLREENPKNPLTLLEPLPRIDPSRTDSGVYCEMMTKGVRPLVKRAAYEVALILIDATAEMIRLRTHQEDCNNGVDYSEAWCERISVTEGDFDNPATALVHTLTFACEQVYRNFPDVIGELDKKLRDQKWKVFKRLRYHLYSHFPEKTKPWIREVILAHKGYNRYEHRYEFQKMIQRACKHFGASLLTEKERARIFAEIRSGPSREHFRNWMGDEFTEQAFQERQRNFHRMQFGSFAPLLFGEYKIYFRELVAEVENPISDENYSPYRIQSCVGANNRSPCSPDDLASYDDENLLRYINDWKNEEVFYDGSEYMEINIQGLSQAFETVFKESIILNSDRLGFWMENVKRIERPIFLEKMLAVMRERIEANNFDRLHDWLEFCHRVLIHTDCRTKDAKKPGEDSEEVPEWYNPRRTVGDLISSFFDKSDYVHCSAYNQITKLFELLCTQSDPCLFRNPNQFNPFIHGLNCVRSRALHDLVKFGLWLRRHGHQPELSGVARILEMRLDRNTHCPLTLPEYAILGVNFARIFSLNEEWSIKHKSDFFPQHRLSSWLAAFGSFVGYSNPFEGSFKILRDDYNFALQYLDEFGNRDDSEDRFIDNLGQHLFIYYLWDMYSLRGHESLLKSYYDAADGNRDLWADLFDYVGRTLDKYGKDLEESLKEKIYRFFDWRFEFREHKELQKITFWLKAEGLDAEWRLESYSKILNFCRAENIEITIQVDALCKMLTNHTARVVECFAKLTKDIGEHNILIYTEKAKTIIQTGLTSDDSSVRENAVNAQENLLREGRFDLMELDDLQS